MAEESDSIFTELGIHLEQIMRKSTGNNSVRLFVFTQIISKGWNVKKLTMKPYFVCVCVCMRACVRTYVCVCVSSKEQKLF